VFTEFEEVVPLSPADALTLTDGSDADGLHRHSKLDNGQPNEVTAADLRVHLDNLTKHRAINDAGTLATELFSALKILAELALKEDAANKGVNNGYAPLDGSALVPLSSLPDSVKTGSEYKGAYNATTNTPTLVNGTGSNGDYHRVNIAGSQDFGAGSITFLIGDIVVYNGTTLIWERVAGNPDLVQSVAGKQGAVTLDAADIAETASLKILTSVERSEIAANTLKETNATHTGDVTGDEALTIADNAVTNAKAADMPANTIKSNPTAGTTDPSDLVMAASTVLARLASGNIVAATSGEMKTLLGYMTDLIDDSTPQLGGDLDALSKKITNVLQLGVGGAFTPDASAVLEAKSTTGGVLLPRMTTAQRDAITLPATGLIIDNTNVDKGFLERNVGTPGAPIWRPVGFNVEALGQTIALISGGDVTTNGGDPNKYDISEARVMRIEAVTLELCLKTISAVAAVAHTAGAAGGTHVFVANNLTFAQEEFSILFSETRAATDLSLSILAHGPAVALPFVEQVVISKLSERLAMSASDRGNGFVRLSGLRIEPNGANMSLNRTAGTQLSPVYENFHVDRLNPMGPSLLVQNLFAWFYAFQDGSGGFTFLFNQTTLDFDNFDDGSGSLASVGANDFTVQAILEGGANSFGIQYDQNTYNTLAEAEDSFRDAPFIKTATLVGTSIRAYIICRQNISNLTTAIAGGNAKIIKPSGDHVTNRQD
jgi:hypothetical protein